ncbi:MAG: hypothetical protein KGZ30_04330 [Anaplasmataceae bacterium]|nr:hypothetical protein [Anaplasmataceae bacterium]
MKRIPYFNHLDRYCLLLVGREKITESLIEITPEREIIELGFENNRELNNQTHISGLRSGYKGIVGLHPSVSYSVSLPLHIERGESHSPHLTGPEVENLLTKEVSQRFIQFRNEASESLGIDQVDTILTDSRVGNFKVNGRHIVHPVGCVAKSFEATTELTFTSRNLYESIKRYFNRRNFFLSDSGRSLLKAIAKEEQSPLGLLALDYPQSAYIRLERKGVKEPFLKRVVIHWSTNSLTDVVMTSWHIDREVAEAIWRKYIDQQLPREALDFLKSKFQKVTQPLEKIIHKLPSQGENFIISSREIPQDLLDIATHPSPLPYLHSRLEKMGFTLNSEKETNLASHPLLLGTIEDYFSDRGHTDINRWLRRRLHWLGSVEYN